MLILKNKKSGDIQSALMHVFSNSGTEEKNMTYSKGKENFTGTVFFTDLDGNFVNGWQYEKGKIIRKGDKEVSANNASAKLPLPGEGECQILEISWYQRDCQEVTYNSGVYTCGPWQYLSSTYVTYCFPTGGGSDGGGSYGGGESLKCDKFTTDLNTYASSGIEMSEKRPITTNTETSVMRDKNYPWAVYMFPGSSLPFVGTLPPIIFISHETGITVKNNSNEWVWESLTHKTFSKEGISVVIIPSISLNNANANISGTIATMDLSFNIGVSVICKGVATEIESNHKRSNRWYASE